MEVYAFLFVSEQRDFDATELATSDTAINIAVSEPGANDHVPYAKADFTLLAQVGDTVAISFYQFDYQAIIYQKQVAAKAATAPGNMTIDARPIVVSKVALDREGFKRLYAEMKELGKKIGLEG